MIKIEGTEAIYELDLNKSINKEYILTIDSRDENGIIIPWAVMLSSNQTVYYNEEGIDKLHLVFDLTLIRKEEYILIENYKKEKIKIIIKPNLKEIEEKKYVFSAKKYDILDINKIKIYVNSKVNGSFAEWKCSYNGKPLVYNITMKKTYIILDLKSIPLGDINGYIELKQEKSNKKINIKLNHHRKEQMSVESIY